MRRYIEVHLSDGRSKYFYDVVDEDESRVARHTFKVKHGALVIYLLPPPAAAYQGAYLDAHRLAAWAPGLWDSCHARLDEGNHESEND